MSEGKLKNQIDVLVEPYEQVFFNEVDENPFTKDDVFDILDEAKQEFPLALTAKDAIRTFYKSDFKRLLEVEKWFEKWFGNGETK